MILSTAELKGSIQDRPEYMDKYDENNALFKEELGKLKAIVPGNTGWMKALYFFRIYKGPEGYRIALPKKWITVDVDGCEDFGEYFLTKTVFPNKFQAMQIAARILDKETGY